MLLGEGTRKIFGGQCLRETPIEHMVRAGRDTFSDTENNEIDSKKRNILR